MIELFQSILTIDLLGAVGIGLLGGLMHGYTGWGGAMVMMPLNERATSCQARDAIPTHEFL